jgi:hypothetical protein
MYENVASERRKARKRRAEPVAFKDEGTENLRERHWFLLGRVPYSLPSGWSLSLPFIRGAGQAEMDLAAQDNGRQIICDAMKVENAKGGEFCPSI